MSPADFSGNVDRFTGFADLYDRYRAGPPAALSDLIAAFSGSTQTTLVVDLGSGTGLSTRYWATRSAKVIGIEPTPDMRRQAGQATRETNVSYQDGLSHATNLPDRCAEIVVCAQSLHWMEPRATFLEAKRILKPGGVFAAYDYDWPPVAGSWEADAAYETAVRRARELEKKAGLTARVKQWEKGGHADRMRESGVFRHVKEAALHHVDTGNAERFVGLFESQGYVAGLRKKGISDADIGIDALRAVANQFLGNGPRAWLWTAKLRLGAV